MVKEGKILTGFRSHQEVFRTLSSNRLGEFEGILREPNDSQMPKA